MQVPVVKVPASAATPRATEPKGTAAGPRSLGAVVALALASLTGCAGPPAPPEAPPPGAEAPLAPGALRVRLVFGEEADLDLYVTDPRLETVYFANTPIPSGGSIDTDRRCDSPTPRVEQVGFERAPGGRYRVGVDFPRRCRLSVGKVPYLVIVESASLRQEHRGEIEFARFDPRVLEFTIPGADGPP